MYNIPRVKIFVNGLISFMETIIIQGGMGFAVSGWRLASAVARQGGIGVLSAVGLDIIVSKILGRKVNHFDAAKYSVEEAIRLSEGRGMIGVNVMVLMHTYEASVRGAIAGGAKIIFAGAGMPLNLPEFVVDYPKVLLAPIVSSVRALEIICKKWERFGRLPDLVVLEGPLAGGHLGFKIEDIEKPEFQLEKIFPPVLEFCQNHGNIPLVVAGGIWDQADIIRWIELGATGVQMGTRFLATKESSGSEDFKNAVIKVKAEDIIIANNPGSPSGWPFRIIRPEIDLLKLTKPICKLGYMVHNGVCKAVNDAQYFCICSHLLSAVGYNPDWNQKSIFTVGANAYRVDKILSVKELFYRLTGVIR